MTRPPIARYLALVFAAFFSIALWRAVAQPSVITIVDAVLFGGLAVLWFAIVRRGRL